MRMNMLLRKPVRYIKFQRLFYEGEADAGQEGQNQEGKGQEGKGQESRKFSQEEVNGFIAKDRDKIRKENARLLDDLKKLREEGLTPEVKSELENRIQQLEDAGKTQEQLKAEEIDRVNKKWEKEHAKEKQRGDNALKMYSDYRTRTEILENSTSKKLLGEKTARNPNQIVELLMPKTYMAERLDDQGKPTGELIPRVKLPDIKDGKPTTLDLTVTEAVKRMSEMEDHGNLFNSGVNGGLGGGNNSSKSEGGPPTDTNAFMGQWFDKDKSKRKTMIGP